jgi:hypothetical protein
VLSPATVDRYRVAILQVRASPVGGLPVIKLRPHHIEDLYSELLGNGQSGDLTSPGCFHDGGFLKACLAEWWLSFGYREKTPLRLPSIERHSGSGLGTSIDEP